MRDYPTTCPTAPVRAAWRIWASPILTIMIMMAEIAFRGRHLTAPTTAQLIIVLAGAMALLFRLRHPLAVVVVTLLADSTLPLFPPHLVPTDAASVVALYTLATLRDLRVAGLTGAAGALVLTLTPVPWQPEGWADIHNVLPANYVALAVAVGTATRNRRALLAEIHQRAVQAERTREEESHRRVREERIRIARDLHDVVTHHIALVNAQAGVAHHLMSTHPDQARQALAGIRDTSRAALDELRATVGLLRGEDDPPQSRQPAPSLAVIDELLDSFRSGGLDVTLTREGPPRPLAGVADLAAYRILQEALTNASKHGTTRHAEIHLVYDDGRLALSISNPARPGHHGPGTGHGLIGMRERADAAGGALTAGMHPDGRFTVQAVLPLQGPHP